MPPQLQPYVHKPLPAASNQFRLVRLRRPQPVFESFELHCSIVVADLSDPLLSYNALSYVWGESAPSKRVIVEDSPAGQGGHGGQQHFIAVTETLEVALKHVIDLDFAPEGADLLIYVDQLCIDQVNLREKNHQVTLMGDIYRQSSRVIAWLGPRTYYSDAFMDRAAIVDAMTSHIPLSASPSMWLLSFDQRHAESRIQAVLESCYSGSGAGITKSEEQEEAVRHFQKYKDELPRQGFFDIVSRAWFRRLWIVQEASLGNNLTFVCGSRSLSCECFKRLLNLTVLSAAFSQSRRGPRVTWDMTGYAEQMEATESHNALIRVALPSCQVLSTRDAILFSRNSDRQDTDPSSQGLDLAKTTLFDLVKTYNVNMMAWPYKGYMDPEEVRKELLFDTSNPRDRIYALRGLASTQDKAVLDDLPVDYQLSVAEVNRQFAIAVLKEDSDVLLFAQGGVVSGRSLWPSWVPRWSFDGTRLPRGYMGHTPIFSAGMRQDPSHERFDPPRADPNDFLTLLISGVIVDKVRSVGEAEMEARPNAMTGNKQDLFYTQLNFYKEAQVFCAQAFQMANPLCVCTLADRDKATWLMPTGGIGLRLQKYETDPEDEDADYPTAIFGPKVSWGTWSVNGKRQAPLGNLFDNTLNFCTMYRRVTEALAENRVFDMDVLVGGLILWFIGFSLERIHWLLPMVFGWGVVRKQLHRLTVFVILFSRASYREYDYAVGRNLGRKCILTLDGFVGLGPANAKPGDILVLIYGCSAPLLLRPTRKRGYGAKEAYSLVGEAYVYGIMEGEFFQRRPAEPTTTFRIV